MYCSLGQLQKPCVDLFLIHHGICALLDAHPGGLTIQCPSLHQFTHISLFPLMYTFE